MSDRLDDTLRHLARADAPADLSARVRVALETGPRAAPLWPTLAAAAVVVLLAAVGAFVVGDRGAEAPPPHARGELRGGGVSAPRSPAHVARVVPPDVDRGEAPPPRRRVRVRTIMPLADHEHALPSLADIAAVGPAALSTLPMSVEATDVAPLAPIAPMEIPALDAGEGERR